jgi:antitoxin (DNA-binding transcriptional repressor) of toxin-antitoxin stability system
MSENRARVDVDALPELLHLIEEVEESGESRILVHEGEDVAVITPLRPAMSVDPASQPRKKSRRDPQREGPVPRRCD